jgi:hypothetical protein
LIQTSEQETDTLSTSYWDRLQTEVRETRALIAAREANYSEEMRASLAVLDQRWDDAQARWQARVVDYDYHLVRQDVERFLAGVKDSIDANQVKEWDPLVEQFEDHIQLMEAAADTTSIDKVVDDRALLEGRLELLHDRWKQQTSS